jgi:chorismate mutase/prephenate dehydratase
MTDTPQPQPDQPGGANASGSTPTGGAPSDGNTVGGKPVGRDPNTPPPPGIDLNELRKRIDAVDRKLVEVLNERARLVVDVGSLKRGDGTPIYAPHREQAVIGRAIANNQGPLYDKTVEAVYREIMSGSFALEQPLRIGFLGPAGSFSHEAAQKQFGSSVSFEDLHEIRGVFTEVARGHVDYGLVPIENSTIGGVVETLDAFREFAGRLNIYTEVALGVKMCLLANCQPREVRRVHSKTEALSQCRNWLSTQYPKAELVPAPSTSRAVQLARAEELLEPGSGAAAIGSRLAGQLHQVEVLFEGIEDDPNNVTRFFVLSKQSAERSGDDKTSIMFTTEDKPGALVDVLTVFRDAGVNLSHIDKRPSGRENWQYTFFIDAVGHRTDQSVASAIDTASEVCRELTVLGSYPRAKRVL